MNSNLNTSKDNNENRINILEDITPRYTSRTIRNDGIEQEIDLENIKKDHRNTVFSQRTHLIHFKSGMIPIMGANNFNYFDILQKKYLFIISKYEKILQEASKINKKLEDNTKEIEELNNGLKKLKEEKKKKQSDIVNYLSNKESLEEILKNQISYSIRHKRQSKANLENKEINHNVDTLKTHSSEDSQIFDIDDEKEIVIKMEEIKKSDKNKFTEQVINFSEEILNKKGDEELINKIKSKIKIAYNIFFSEISSNSPIDYESVITHFFSRIGLYISNYSLGLYSETSVNKFLRYLIKINNINVEISNILKFLNKKYKDQKTEMRNKINNLKKRNENLKEKKIICDKNIEKYEKIIQKNKEYMQNLKQNSDDNVEGKDRKRKYMVNTLNRRQIGKSNTLRILTGENNIIQRNNIDKENEEEIDNLRNIQLTNENIFEYEPNYNTNENRNPKKSKFKSKISPEAKNSIKENKIKDNTKDKNNSFKSKEKKNIIITKNTKIILKKSGKQPNTNNSNSNSYKAKESSNNDNIAETKTANSISNPNFFDDSKDVDSEVNSRNLNNSNSINQNYIVFKNDINIKNINSKNSSNVISNNNNIYPNNMKKESIKVIRPNASVTNNNLIKKYNNDRKEKTQNNNQEHYRNFEENDKNKKNYNLPKTKYNKNIYIINNINNSEQIQTKNNIYGNKSNNLNINSNGNLNLDNYNENNNRNNKSNNYNAINSHQNIYYTGNRIKNNRPIIKINNNYQANNTIQDNKNKPNYNFHDILQVNTRKNNNRSVTISSSDNPEVNNKNNNTNNEWVIKLSKQALYPAKPAEKKSHYTFQKNSFDYKADNNKGYNINYNINNKTYEDNIFKKPDNMKVMNGVNNKNNSYKISIYCKKKDKSEDKK